MSGDAKGEGSGELPLVFDGKTGAALWEDRRELRLRYQISVERTRKFYDGLREGRVLTTRCRSCGELYFPPQSFCTRCGSEDMEWVELSGEGELLTFTVIKAKPTSFSHYGDYTVGIARMPEGVNVLAWVSGDPGKLRVGTRVRLRVVRREPEDYLTYELQPIE
ncbi:MAG: Zn-ribbon domain-containing OB-fold protein [Conexivisphaerales archaeon]|nr:Zn-ribbon domain-containing OB-fold protein [Conexivisphaerales archaeon]